MRNDLIGKKFGMLTIREMLRFRFCVCDCDCGAIGLKKRYDHVEAGLAKSCGCAKGDFVAANRSVHGEARRRTGKSPEFKVWAGLKQRCLNPNSKNWKDYGGRGITIAPEWLDDFPAFLSHVGRRPTPNHQIDRIKNELGYEPGNVRWALRKEQCRNRRTSKLVTAFGETRTVAEWAEMAGMQQATLGNRLRLGWSAERAIETRVA